MIEKEGDYKIVVSRNYDTIEVCVNALLPYCPEGWRQNGSTNNTPYCCYITEWVYVARTHNETKNWINTVVSGIKSTMKTTVDESQYWDGYTDGYTTTLNKEGI